MNGKEETPNINQSEEETFNRLRRITFSQLVDRLKVYWIDQEVINILDDTKYDNWDDWGGTLDAGGWGRYEFTDECRKQCALGNFTKAQYLEKIDL